MQSPRDRGFEAWVKIMVALLCSGFVGGRMAQSDTLPRPKTEASVQATSQPGKPAAQPATTSANSSTDTARGSEIYFSTCMPCHGDAGQGGPGGGMPFTDALTVDSIAAILRTGRNNMPEFGSVYTVEDIDSIAHFVVEKLIRK